MKGLFSIVAALLAFSCQVYCDGPINNNLFYNFTGSEQQDPVQIIYFVVGVSVAGQIGDVCAVGVSNETAGNYCQAIFNDIYPPGFVSVNGSIGYPDFFEYFSENYNYSYTNVSCSNGYSSCTGSQTSNCTASGGLLSIQCSYITPECYPGQTGLNNYVNVSNGPGLFTVTGPPTICVDGSFLPVCSGVSLSHIDVSRICLYSLGISSGFVGAPSGVVVPPLNLTRDLGRVVTGFECTGLTNCTNTTMYGDCSPNGYATLTCQKVCADSDNFTLFSNQTTMVELNGISYYIGIPQFCAGGTYARVCNDGTNYPYGSIFCRGAGFAFGNLLPSNSSLAQTLYSGSPQGIIYFSNFTCSGTDENCDNNPSFSSNPQCYTGQLETILRCSPGIPCNGSKLYLHNNITRIVNGREIVSGIPIYCIDGAFYASLRNDGSQTPAVLNLFCQSMGFDNNGVILSHDSSVYGTAPVGTAYYSSFSCPLTANTVDDCDALSSTNQQCLAGTMDLVLQCSRAASTVTPSVTSRPTPSGSASVLANGVTVSVLVALILAVLLLA
ncbi:PREDICTED: uncharacterized protein LOC100640093 [Amphimedon queenslandica]|uniref:SRCR domain-containing protein n=1 Tax=Amphimedon queenslandica TaxID=400682 RepID=A0A1X7SZS2_AMPQE|nr:PREDICTED: uncharacterized protein LOC100640093 [Amphimedon queenslandica]|eukprot:XP_003391352.1 PREDICTED: uncharacterized protein LOC100640093 [Amphimedon queenslandica]